ncbi:GAF domain-containing protein [Micromonospora sp. DT31]|uniref:GAF domain-containing protein n=1 Tax=Micromonospora sp. DT31 TaxID=3393434 RepID=UPI003CF2160F
MPPRPSGGRVEHDCSGVRSSRTAGPCLDCFHTGRPVSVADLTQTTVRWPRFTAAAAEVGFAAVHALPMRLRSEVIGALNLFDVRPGALDEDKLASVRRSPTWPPSDCCNTAPSTDATCSPNSCKPL